MEIERGVGRCPLVQDALGGHVLDATAPGAIAEQVLDCCVSIELALNWRLVEFVE